MWFGHGHASTRREQSGGSGGVSFLTAWARYADWLITTPLLLVDLLWVAGRHKPYDLVSIIVLDVVMIVLGWIAAFVMYSWPRYVLWALSTLTMLAIFAYLVYFRNREHFLTEEGEQNHDGEKEYKRYKASVPWIFVVWTLYPLVWIASKDGLAWIDTCQEVTSYAVLDVLAKAGFGAFLLYVV
jgi:bacteriorhodopsin